MDFDLSDKQRQIRDTVRDFAQGEIAPKAAAYDISGDFPYDLVAGMASLGFSLCLSMKVLAAPAATSFPIAWPWKRSPERMPAVRSHLKPRFRWESHRLFSSAQKNNRSDGCHRSWRAKSCGHSD